MLARYTVLVATRAEGPYEKLATDVAPVGFGAVLRYEDGAGTPGETYHYTVRKADEGKASRHLVRA